MGLGGSKQQQKGGAGMMRWLSRPDKPASSTTTTTTTSTSSTSSSTAAATSTGQQQQSVGGGKLGGHTGSVIHTEEVGLNSSAPPSGRSSPAQALEGGAHPPLPTSSSAPTVNTFIKSLASRSRTGSSVVASSLGLGPSSSPSVVNKLLGKLSPHHHHHSQQQQQHFSGAALHSAVFSGDAPSKGIKETAALLEHLHITKGPVEFFIEALFDPTAAHLTLSGSGEVVYLAPPPLFPLGHPQRVEALMWRG